MGDRKAEIISKILAGIREKESDTLNFAISNFLAKKALSLHSIHGDLLFIRNSINELRKLKKRRLWFISETRKITIEGSLWYSIISFYGRCFTDASNAAKTKLEPKDCFASDKGDYLKIHNTLMELRHNFIAHRGDTHNEQSVLILKYSMDSDKDSVYRFKSARAYSPSIRELEDYDNLVSHLIEFVSDKIGKQIHRINSKFLELETEELIKMIIKNSD